MARQEVTCCKYRQEIIDVFRSQGYVYGGFVGQTHFIDDSSGRRVASVTGSSISSRNGDLLKNSNLVKALAEIGVEISRSPARVSKVR